MTINLKEPELRELKPRIMVCGVGGGGCIAGVTTYLAERTSTTSVLGVEPAGAPSMRARVRCTTLSTIVWSAPEMKILLPRMRW